MAIKKVRLIKINEDKSQDTIHLETTADMVIRVQADGSSTTLEEDLKKVEETVEKVKEDVKDLGGGGVDEPIDPDKPPDKDPDKEPGGDDIDDPPTNDGTINGYKPGESVNFVPNVGEGLTGTCSRWYYFVFENADFVDNKIKIPQRMHQMDPKQTNVMCRVRSRIGRTAADYFSDTPISTIRDELVKCQKAGLDRYVAGDHTGFPMDEDGNVILIWEQVQVWLLEGVMKTRSEARDYCLSKGINWKNIPTFDVTTNVTIEDLMTACYIPAATPGASTALIDRILTHDVVHALHLRHRDKNAAVQSKYDLFGTMTTGAWQDVQTQVYWDLRTGELIIDAPNPYPGDILVVG
ncbi:MAG: hypothetical protein NC489_08195 [Ruminococcus flavefaciens]|nr:hypothetical protein [Ruminococcus flavefaciens]